MALQSTILPSLELGVLHCFVLAGMGALLFVRFVIGLAVLERGGSSETMSRVMAV